MHIPLIDTQKRTVVHVIYNGLTKEIEYSPNAAIQAILQHSIQAFGVVQSPHTLSLYTKDGHELSDALSGEAAGIHPGDHLLLRPSAVKGGT